MISSHIETKKIFHENTNDAQNVGNDDQFGSLYIDKLQSSIYGRNTRARTLRRSFCH